MLLKYTGKTIKTVVRLPGSKSISNRCLILREILNPGIGLQNISSASDTQDLIKALTQIHEPGNKLIDVGHAGTDMRFLTALLSIKKGEWTLTGSERMKERPIKELVEALRSLGADITYLEKEGFPPLKITGNELQGGKITIDAAISSQFVSALLLIAPALKNGLEITLTGNIVSWSYILMTLDVLSQFGIRVSTINQTIIVRENQDSKEDTDLKEYFIESDWSSASYWYSIAALSRESEITLTGLHEKSSQGDSVLQNIYEKLGVTSEFKTKNLILTKKPVTLSLFEYDCTNCPDIAQTIAVTCLGLGINCRLTGLSTLKHKETDRLLALKTELEKFNVQVAIANDSLELAHIDETRSRKQETGLISVATYNDHRMAMSFAPLVLCFNELLIENPGVVKKSYPEFWDHLTTAGIAVP
ncbi:MAG: 3-phosphoshikimate 1-carboxyvinyltransferase [Bacteroidia bacterium]